MWRKWRRVIRGCGLKLSRMDGHAGYTAAFAALSRAGKLGVPTPVTGSHPFVHSHPYFSGVPSRLSLLLPCVTSVKALRGGEGGDEERYIAAADDIE